MEKRTYCRICEAACGLIAELDPRGELVALRPDKNHPTSRGFVCAKGTRFSEVAHHPDRLLAPMARDASGALSRVSWDAALARAAEKLRPIYQKYGPHSIGVYFGNPIAFNALGLFGLLAFMQRLGTRNVYSAGSQDCANKFAGAEILHGSPAIHPIPDFARADLAVLFGTNPAVSQASFVHLEGGSQVFERMIQEGRGVVWVDPRASESARRWGDHVPIRAGSDVFLLAALVNEFRDRVPAHDPRVSGLAELLDAIRDITPARAAEKTAIPADEIVRLAARIRAAKRTALHMSVGVNQGPFGTLSYVLLHALAYLSGNMDREGGWLFHPLAVALADGFRTMGIGTRKHRSRIGGFESVMDALPGGILADEIATDGPEKIRALIVIAGDPVMSVPGSQKLAEAMRSLECVIAVDMFENATGKLAHLLLPATSWLERWDVATTTVTFQTTRLAQTASAVIPPRGESRGEERILMDLLAAITGERVVPMAGRLSFARWMPSLGYGVPVPAPRAGKYMGRGPRTPGHVVRFHNAMVEHELARLRAALAERTPDDAFVLIGRRRRLGHNAWLHGALRDGDPEAAAWVSDEDFARLGVERGASVAIASEAGELVLPLVPMRGVVHGTVVVPHGVPGHNVNALIPSGVDAIERVSGQLRMTGIPVRVTAV